MSTTTIAVIFLIVSYVGFAVQLASLIRLVSQPPEPTQTARLAYHGLIRTSGCRVTAAVFYIFIGTNALFFELQTAVVTLGTFCFVQILWMVNGRMDVRLKKHIASIHRGEPPMTAPDAAVDAAQNPPEPDPANEHNIPGDVLQRCLDEAAAEQTQP